MPATCQRCFDDLSPGKKKEGEGGRVCHVGQDLRGTWGSSQLLASSLGFSGSFCITVSLRVPLLCLTPAFMFLPLVSLTHRVSDSHCVSLCVSALGVRVRLREEALEPALTDSAFCSL